MGLCVKSFPWMGLFKLWLSSQKGTCFLYLPPEISIKSKLALFGSQPYKRISAWLWQMLWVKFQGKITTLELGSWLSSYECLLVLQRQ